MLLFTRACAAFLLFLSIVCSVFGEGSAMAETEVSQKTSTETAVPSLNAASEALIKVLQDPQSREALIEKLLQIPAVADQTSDGGDVASEKAQLVAEQAKESSVRAKHMGFAVRLGKYTKFLADEIEASFFKIRDSLQGFVQFADGEVQVQRAAAKLAAFEIFVVLAAALIVFILGQKVLVAVFKRYAVQVTYGREALRVFMLVLTTIGDAATVLIGWAAGYGVALIEMGDLRGGVSLMESLALNAFLVTGLAKVALRFVFAPERPVLRLLPFEDTASTYWASRLGLVVSWIGYGVMLGVPTANLTVSDTLGNAVRVFVVLLAVIYLLSLVHRNRRRVGSGIKGYGEHLTSELAKGALARLSGFWHWAAYLYIFVTFGVWWSSPVDAMTIIIRSTAMSILTIMGGSLISVMVTRAIIGGIRLPAGLQESLPALQGRLNAFVPRILKIIRIIVFVVTISILLEIWGAFSFSGWLESPTGSDLVGSLSSGLLVLLVAFMVWLGVMSWVDLRLRAHSGHVVTSRVRTLFQLFRNGFTVVVMVMATLLALSEIGVDIGPLIAGAGVLGLAFSFGAQTLVKDIITGAFIQIENAINEGDVVTVGGTTGTVERLTIRSVCLRDLQGTTHIVPFSSVTMVSNFMRDFSYHVAVIGVSYDTDIKTAKLAMVEAFRRLNESDYGNRILGELEMHGVINFGDSSIDIRARIKTTPGDQWSTGRAYNEILKQVFDEQGIEIPFPQVTYHTAVPAVAGAVVAAAAASADPVAAQNEEYDSGEPAPPDSSGE
ncbi:mechanosensitive ion channel domain-containing protein [Roseibium algae]|uniref:Mechanosensitive ion channel domain-containing protein n=1 Tax=Roseibium algae TaxID=3123038 RepID=A0ABU8TFS5_9HYPH